MAYTKQLAEKERERPGKETASAPAAAASSKRPPPPKKVTKVGTTKNPTKCLHSSSIKAATAGEKWQRLAQLTKLQRRFSADSCPPDRRGVGRRRPSDESFVTANNDSMASDEDGDIDRHELRRACSVREQSRQDDDGGKQFDDNSAVDIGNQTLDDFQEVFIHGGDQTFSYLDDPFEYEEEDEHEGKVTVPISICLIIISGYLFAGASLFAIWENWDLVTGSYFCFITLSTIGFGDIVPGTDMKEWASQAKLVLCSLWLAFGLSLLAMCFNLMQEEVKDKCKWIGQKLGLLKDEGQS